MKTEERRKAILENLAIHGFASVSDLAESMGVTTMTIRTDLNALEAEGKLIHSHGFASIVRNAVVELKEDDKSKVNVEAKQAIAASASALIEPYDAIVVASGSTMVAFAQAVTPKDHLKVVTPSIRIASVFLDNDKVDLFILGGEIYRNSYSVRGIYAESALELIQCGKCFFGVEGFDVEAGLTCNNIEEATLTRKMMSSAQKTIVLADSSKFCRRGFAKICDLKDVDILVTDSGISDKARKSITELGVEVIMA